MFLNMVDFTKPEAYEKQIAVYLANTQYQQAYELSKQFVEKFGQDMISHFLLMKSAFWLKKFDEAIKEGRIAFNLAHDKDMVICAIVLSSAYYLKGEYEKAYELLNDITTKDNEDVEKLLFIYSLAINNEKAAMQHIEKLYNINRRLAEDLVLKFL